MQEIAQTSTMVPSLDLKKIRKTNETPPRVSIIDLIAIISKASNPRDTWSEMQKTHPDVVGNTDNFSDFKFPGQGQRKTPVIDATGAIMIINFLPGQLAASFRAEWASIIVRYLGGDMTATVAQQATMQESSTDFLSYLRSKLDDEEAHKFFTSFALCFPERESTNHLTNTS